MSPPLGPILSFQGGGGGGSSVNSFATIQTPAGTSPVADSSADTLTLTTSDNSLLITGTASSDTIDFKLAAVPMGTSITSGTAGSVLFVGTGPVLAQNNSQLNWNNTDGTLKVVASAGKSGIIIQGDLDGGTGLINPLVWKNRAGTLTLGSLGGYLSYGQFSLIGDATDAAVGGEIGEWTVLDRNRTVFGSDKRVVSLQVRNQGLHNDDSTPYELNISQAGYPRTVMFDVTHQRTGFNVDSGYPLNTVDVKGEMVIGDTYSQTAAAPTDGLLVEGRIGVGITSPDAQTHWRYSIGATLAAATIVAVVDDGDSGTYNAGDFIVYRAHSYSTYLGQTYYSATYSEQSGTVNNTGEGLAVNLGSFDSGLGSPSGIKLLRNVNGGGFNDAMFTDVGTFIDDGTQFTQPPTVTPTSPVGDTRVNYVTGSLPLGFFTNTEAAFGSRAAVGAYYASGDPGAYFTIPVDSLGVTGQIIVGGTSDGALTLYNGGGGAQVILSAAASSPQIQIFSQSLIGTALVGGIEFDTDKYYATITTGAARKELALVDSALTSGRVPIVTTNGRLADDADMTFATDTLTVTGLKVGTTKVSSYNGVTTAGFGIPAIYAAGRLTAKTAAQTSVATYTPTADGSFIISANVLITTSTLYSFTTTCAYTDEGSTARTLTLTFSNVGGTLVTIIANGGGAVPYEGVPLHIRAKANTAITLATVGTFTTVTYNVEGSIRQIS